MCVNMAQFEKLLLVLFLSAVASSMVLPDATTSESMHITWGYQHASLKGDDLQLVLDKTSGSGAETTKAFLFGSVESRIKLVPGNSAGTVTAYYLSSPGSSRDEIDFEFLGNVSGQPYIVHTNLYIQGKGGREQQFYHWFDPTADFHSYAIHWSPFEVVWYIDNIPIRVYRNYENEGIGFPNKQGMKLYTTLWNADWATRGGMDKINWSYAPFTARFNHFRARACMWDGAISIKQCSLNIPANWWTSPTYKQLSPAQLGQLNWVRKNHMIYDYCRDTKRFNGKMPPECYKSQF